MAETFANETYEKELVTTKRIFQQVKNDLVCKHVLYFFKQNCVFILNIEN